MTKTEQHQRTTRHTLPLEVERVYSAHRDAMLQALRVVLDLPRNSISFKDEDNTGGGEGLAINHE